MDAFGPREAPRLIYRDRFGNEQARSKWLSDLDASYRRGLIQELRVLARNARRGAAAASQSKGGVFRKFTASLRPEPLPEPLAAMLRGALLCRASVCAGVRHLERIRSMPPLPQLRKPIP